MATMGEPLEPGERHDFLAKLKLLGFDATQFAVYSSKSSQEVFGSVHERIHVRRESTNITRSYEGGPGKAWAALALDDVKAGLFGPP